MVLRAQLTEVMRREGDLAATLGPRHPALNQARAQARSVAAQLHGEFERAAEADRTVYEAFLARTRQIGDQERIETANVSVISPTQVPDAKSWPPRRLSVLLAALVLGIGGTVGLDLLARRPVTPQWGLPSGR